MSAGITSDVLLAQIAELRRALEAMTAERDAYRYKALLHAGSHRDYRSLCRASQAAIAELRLKSATTETRLANLTRQVADVIQAITTGKVVVMRPHGVSRPER